MTTTSRAIIADSEPTAQFDSRHFPELTPGQALDLLRQLEDVAADAREYVPIGWTRPAA